MRDLSRNALLSASLLLALSGCAQVGGTASAGSPEPSKASAPPQAKPIPAPTPGEPTPPPVRAEPSSSTRTPPCYPADEPMTAAEDNPKFGDYVFVEVLPEAIEKVQPVYPDYAHRQGITGVVMVQAQVRRDGTVGDVCIVKSIPPLDEAAAACVKRWRFKPAMANGHPVAVWIGVPVHFTLQ